jgi:excinuclease ABC subunit B
VKHQNHPADYTRINSNTKFKLTSSYEPKGDQPKAISKIVENLKQGVPSQVLLGVTGSGKTFTAANIIQQLNRPALILAHNKTLAAQLYSEFSELFPDNAVRFFVSYYDYYQPEAYLPSTDTYIEKDASINDEIDKLRHAATKALLERRDVVIVASVSCIYGLGDPKNYFDLMLYLERGDEVDRAEILRKLVSLRYERNDIEFTTGTFRVRGDVVDVCQASESDSCVRIEFFGDEIEELSEIDRLTGKVISRLKSICIYPASHFITTSDKLKQALVTIRKELYEHLPVLERSGKHLEAKRLEQRTLFDLEMLEETGFCSGIENYSRHLTGRLPGQPPPTLIDYFPSDYIVFLDESHVTVPQLVGMYRGDRSRKQTLVDYGFRLPSALDNRPLRFEEFDEKIKQRVYVSATPSQFEIKDSKAIVVEQIIRPTGLLDPRVEVRPARNQVEDMLTAIKTVIERGERVLVTTLTKRMAEDLTEYYREVGLKVKYLHSEIHTLDRVELIRGLRQGVFDVLVGINLLREGLDLPEVSLVGVMDADKEGFLRSETSLIQTIGRAARNLHGLVILYADKETHSIKRAVFETNRRRKIQQEYNIKHAITPQTVKRAPEAIMFSREELVEISSSLDKPALGIPNSAEECRELIQELRSKMYQLAKDQQFEEAAVLRDKILALEKIMLSL